MVEIMVAGDVFPNIPDGTAAFRELRGVLGAADVVAGNCEGVYSDLLSCANNHMIGGGHAGLNDTLAALAGQGIRQREPVPAPPVEADRRRQDQRHGRHFILAPPRGADR
jgi:hypothetical protein